MLGEVDGGGGSGRRLRRLLIVEDDPRLQRTLRDALEPHASELRSEHSVSGGLRAIADWQPELVFLDVVLPDGTALELISQIPETVPMPALVAMTGEATRAQMVRLGQLGVHAFVEKPFDLASMLAAIERALTVAPPLRPTVRASVGRRSLRAVEEEVRETMVNEAISRTGGSTRGAARLLAVSRQVLQYFLRRNGAD